MSTAAPSGAAGLHLARHGRTAFNAEGRFQGHLPVPLDAVGREQAAALAEAVERLAPVTLVCSHIERAHETALIVAARIGLEPVVDERFAETETGAWTGRTFEEIRAEDPDGFERFLALDLDWGFPSGERFVDQRARVRAALADWRARLDGGPIVVVCHGNTIRLALGGRGGQTPGRPENGSLVAL